MPHVSYIFYCNYDTVDKTFKELEAKLLVQGQIYNITQLSYCGSLPHTAVSFVIKDRFQFSFFNFMPTHTGSLFVALSLYGIKVQQPISLC